MNLFELGALLVGLSALFGYINYRYLSVPQPIGLVLIALVASLALLIVETVIPAANVDALIVDVLGEIDFHDTLMHGMLSFLLFAGALHVDVAALRNRFRTIGLMATAGTFVSTLFIGSGTWLLADWFGQPIPFVWALVFGALISPTDPVAVLALFNTVPVPPSLKVTLAGESLFNDGVGVVAFTILLGVALHGGSPSVSHVLELFAAEILGGVVLGLAAGYVCYRLLHGLFELNLQVLITLAAVTVCYAAAIRLDASGPIAMVVAGLFVGNAGMKYALTEGSREYLQQFWSLLDEILNSILFLLIGLEVLIIARGGFEFWMALVVIPLALAGRWLSVFLSALAMRRWEAYTAGTVPILTWGGLRGGIAVALALSLPLNDVRPAVLSITYAVVLFSIIVQGLSVTRLVRSLVPAQSVRSEQAPVVQAPGFRRSMSRGPAPARSARYQGRCTARKARASFSRSGPWRRRPSPSRRSRPGFRPARRSSFWERTCGCRRFGCARFRRPRRPGAPESRFSAVKGPPCRYRPRPSRTATMRPQQSTAGVRARENWPFPRIRNEDGTPPRSPAAPWKTRHSRALLRGQAGVGSRFRLDAWAGSTEPTDRGRVGREDEGALSHPTPRTQAHARLTASEEDGCDGTPSAVRENRALGHPKRATYGFEPESLQLHNQPPFVRGAGPFSLRSTDPGRR